MCSGMPSCIIEPMHLRTCSIGCCRRSATSPVDRKSSFSSGFTQPRSPERSRRGSHCCPRFVKHSRICRPTSSSSRRRATAAHTGDGHMRLDLIYGTKTGVELLKSGIPVVVAGEAWVRGKGVTLDASSPREYFRISTDYRLAAGWTRILVRRARMYAYHFFFRRMIPLPFVRHEEGEPPPFSVEIDGLRDLLPGQHDGLDVICDGILNGSPFVYPAERLASSTLATARAQRLIPVLRNAQCCHSPRGGGWNVAARRRRERRGWRRSPVHHLHPGERTGLDVLSNVELGSASRRLAGAAAGETATAAAYSQLSANRVGASSSASEPVYS